MFGNVVAAVNASSKSEPGGHGSTSHSSGMPLPVQSWLEPLLMSHESGIPFPLQSWAVPDAMSHESKLPLPLQSGETAPFWQNPPTHVSTPLHGLPSSHSALVSQSGAGGAMFTALNRLMRPEPSS